MSAFWIFASVVVLLLFIDDKWSDIKRLYSERTEALRPIDRNRPKPKPPGSDRHKPVTTRV